MMNYRLSVCLLYIAGLVAASLGESIINENFSYADGDLAGKGDWVQSTAPGVDSSYGAFNVTNNTADTTSAARPNADNSWYVNLTGTPTGNAVDDEWVGSMDFSINFNTNIWRHGGLFRIGMAASDTNYLAGTAADIAIGLESEWNTHFELGTYDASGAQILSQPKIDHAAFGMDMASGDMESDPMRLTWTIRKTRTTGYYGVTVSVQNLTSTSNYPGSTVYVELADLYADADPVYMMGHHKGATWTKDLPAGFYGRKNITIDSLALDRTSGNAPVLAQPVVSAVGGNEFIDLSWAVVPDVTTYDVMRSLAVDGTYIAVPGGIGLTDTTFTDTGLSNGTEYFYKVVAKATGAADAESDPVSAVPTNPQTGNYLADDFTAGEGFADADLAGQGSWIALPGTSANAFTVDSAGNGYATANSATNTKGVITALVTSNNVNDAWTGSLNFTLNTDPVDDLYRTNIYTDVDGVTQVTNVQQIGKYISSVHKGMIFGLTGDGGVPLTSGGKDATFTVIYNWGGSINIGFAMYNNGANTLMSLSRQQLGWDPAWQDSPASNGPIFETKPIQLDFTIRKTATEDNYSAKLTATIDGVVHDSDWVYTMDDETHTWMQIEETYASDLLAFGVQSSIVDGDSIYPKLDSVNLSHEADSVVPVAIPFNIATAPGDSSIILDWTGSSEQTGFNVYRSEVQGGPYSLVTNVPDTDFNATYTDTGLTLKRTYFYVITANYDVAGESAYSEEVNRRALGYAEHIRFGSYTDWSAGNNDMAMGTAMTNSAGTLKYWISQGVSNSIVADVSHVNQAQLPNWPYMYVQMPVATADPIKMQSRTQDVLDISANGAALLIYAEGTPYNASATALGMETQTFGKWNTYYRLAIRSGGQWYASNRETAGSGTVQVADLRDETWSIFEIPSAASTEMMAASGPFVSGHSLDLSAVNAVGYLVEIQPAGSWSWVNGFKTTYGTVLTAFDLWCDNNGIYNDNTDPALDLDSDGKDSAWEWGLGGDPWDDTDIGIVERYSGTDESGNFVYIYPRLKSSARPVYKALESDNLVHTLFWDNEAAYTITAGGDWTDEPDFEAVTNTIPTTDSLKFITLDVE